MRLYSYRRVKPLAPLSRETSIAYCNGSTLLHDPALVKD